MGLEELADRLGVTLLEHVGGEKGRHYRRGIISLRQGLPWATRRVTLAHELAHHILGHTPTGDAWMSARQERHADELAAELLISVEDYVRAESLVGCHAGALAQELGVTRHLIHVWRGLHQRARA